MIFTQLNPPIPMTAPHGKGYAIAVIDYGPEYHLLWCIASDETGEIWCEPNPVVRMRENYSLGRTYDAR